MLKMLREENFIKQRDICNILNISQSTYSDMENNINIIDLDLKTIVILSLIYNIDIISFISNGKEIRKLNTYEKNRCIKYTSVDLKYLDIIWKKIEKSNIDVSEIDFSRIENYKR